MMLTHLFTIRELHAGVNWQAWPTWGYAPALHPVFRPIHYLHAVSRGCPDHASHTELVPSTQVDTLAIVKKTVPAHFVSFLH